MNRDKIFIWLGIGLVAAFCLMVGYNSLLHSPAPLEKTKEIYFHSGDIIRVALCPLHSWSELESSWARCSTRIHLTYNLTSFLNESLLCEQIHVDKLPPCQIYETRLREAGKEIPTYLPMRSYIPIYDEQDYFVYVFHPFPHRENDSLVYPSPKAFMFRAEGNWTQGFMNVDSGEEWWYQ